MKISIDTSLNTITDLETGQDIISMPRSPYAFRQMLREVLTPAQYGISVLRDTNFTLSKKRFEILIEYKNKHDGKRI